MVQRPDASDNSLKEKLGRRSLADGRFDARSGKWAPFGLARDRPTEIDLRKEEEDATEPAHRLSRSRLSAQGWKRVQGVMMEINLLSDLEVGIYHYFVTPCQIVQFRNMTVDESAERANKGVGCTLLCIGSQFYALLARCAIGKGRRRAPQLQIYSGRRGEQFLNTAGQRSFNLR